VRFVVRVPREVIEERLAGETPANMVKRLAMKKADAARRRDPGDPILAADTVVALGKKIFGKPRDILEARRMLLELEGKWHQVWTGVAFLHGRKRPKTFVECTGVRFRKIPRGELEAYLRTRAPYDKAGGYDIQGRAGDWIAQIHGDYLNVMGLPLQRTLEVLGGGAGAPFGNGRSTSVSFRSRP